MGWLSYNSFLCLGSALSFLSIASIVSCGSFASLGSLGSICSICSLGSVLSIASAGSTLSIASTNCYFKIFTDCRQKPHSVSAIRLQFGDDAWQRMKACNFTGYKADPRAPVCDYQSVSIKITINGEEKEMQCKGRRKGVSTWKEVDKTPSFKIKCPGRVELGTHTCSGAEQCPGGGDSNRWYSKKFILNNGGYSTNGLAGSGWINRYYTWGEVDFYVMLRKIGGFAWPFASWVDVQVLHEQSQISHDQYVLLENIDDKDFGKKWLGDAGWGMWEISQPMSVTLERDYGTFNCNDHDTGCGVNETIYMTPELLDAQLGMFNQTLHSQDAALTYYAAEKIGNHWDGMCTGIAHNHFLATNGTGWYIIAHGADATYQTCRYRVSSPTCRFMQECFESRACSDHFDAVYKRAKEHAHRTTPSCFDEVFQYVLYGAMGVSISLCIVLSMRKPTNRRRADPAPNQTAYRKVPKENEFENSRRPLSGKNFCV